MSVIIGTAMNLLSPRVKFIGTYRAGERTDSHTSCCTKLVRMVVMIMSMQILSHWGKENCAMTALHPAGSDREGQSQKNLWPIPEGLAGPTSGDRDPLVKLLMEKAATQDGILEDHLLVINRGLLSQDCNQENVYVVWNLEASLGQEMWKIIMELLALRCHVTIHVWFSILPTKYSLGDGNVSLIISNSPPTIPALMT